jgi:hypothetical protein
VKAGVEQQVVDPVAVEREAVQADPSRLAAWLQEHLGQQLTAYLTGLRDQKMVGRWAAGRTRPRDISLYRLQYAYQAARMLVGAYGDNIARWWFAGTNSLLDDRAPAWVLRHGTTPEQWQPVIASAKHFAHDSGGAY